MNFEEETKVKYVGSQEPLATSAQESGGKITTNKQMKKKTEENMSTKDRGVGSEHYNHYIE